jgi:sulfoacetaldehyde dehydrogenase
MEDVGKTIKGYIERARVAQRQIENYSQEAIDSVCVAIGYAMYADDHIERLARLAVSETKMGNVEDKIKKHKNKVLGVLKDIKGALSVGLIEEDHDKRIRKYAKPVGIVGALTPVTNPTATPASNAITILKGRNAVIFAPHPKSKNASKLAIDLMREGLVKVGAPKDLIQIIEEPSIDLTGELMKQVDVVLATGGGAMVKAAYSSGTPAYGVGPGNAVQIVAEDADIASAAQKIHASKSFDYATSCSSENALIIHDDVYDDMICELENVGAVLLDDGDRDKLEKHMWKTNAKGRLALNPKIVAQSAYVIAEAAGIALENETDILLVEGREDIENDLFSEEKLCPVLTLYRYRDFMDGYHLLERITNHSGLGHSCGIHTKNESYVDFLAENMKTSRIMVNQPQAAANGGAFFNGMPSTVSLGCGSWGGNITTENINYKHFINVTWVAFETEEDRPTDEEIFGSYLDRFERKTS